MAIIAFDGRVLNERGTTAAIYDYADAVERQLGHRAIVFHQKGTDAYNPAVVRMFAERFEPVAYADFADLADRVRASGADVFYGFNYAPTEERLVSGVKNVQHVTFHHYRPQGDVYAYVSEWLASHVTGGRQPWVPHIVGTLPADANLRSEWGFPEDAVVLGRHGGYDQFNLPFVKATVAAALERRPDLHFAFVNTEPFIQSPRVRFLPAVHGLQAKSNFIASCDGMLHARKMGESFGLAIAEFLSQDKPVISWEGGKDRNHLAMIPDRRLVYRTASDLLRILLEFEPGDHGGYYRAATADFTAAAVIRRFNEVFIEGPGEAATRRSVPWSDRARAKLVTRATVLQGSVWREQGLREARRLAAAAAG